MMHRLRRYDVMLRIMMLLVSLAMMRCLPKTLGEADIISVSGIISETTSFAEGKHHSKKPNLSSRQIRLFCWSRVRESNPPSRLGKPLYYRYTNPAGVAIIADTFVECKGFLQDSASSSFSFSPLLFPFFWAIIAPYQEREVFPYAR